MLTQSLADAAFTTGPVPLGGWPAFSRRRGAAWGGGADARPDSANLRRAGCNNSFFAHDFLMMDERAKRCGAKEGKEKKHEEE